MYLGVPETIGVANGTDALVLVLDALGIGPGDEVICPAFTFYATAEAIARQGATPVFAEIDPRRSTSTRRAWPSGSPRTKAIMPVHLFGRPAPLAELPGSGAVIEDAAQAFGSPAIAAPVSPRPSASTRRRTCSASATAVSSRARRRARRPHPHAPLPRLEAKKSFEYVGYNSRLDEIQAAASRIFLRELDGWTALRREAARATASSASATSCDGRPTSPATSTTSSSAARPSATGSAQRSPRPGSATRRTTSRRSISSRRSATSAGRRVLPETERAAAENFSLPLWAGITAEQQERVVERRPRGGRRAGVAW